MKSKLGSYEVVAPIGKGGMGEVYRARDSKLDRDVAIKVLPDDVARDKERVLRFEREAKLLASLNHHNIAAIYGFDEDDEQKFLVLEYVEGETLAQRLARGPMPVEETLEVGRDIAGALESAHANGVIHRDLKPGNIMITPDGTVKVLDFGLAKAFDDQSSGSVLANSPTITAEHTRPGVLLGTAAYMSPEQARCQPLDKRTDIWSYGVILFECLTGHKLFGGESPTDSLGAVMHAEVDFSQLPTNTPPTVQLLLRRCLHRDRKHRLQDIGDARVELDAAIADPSSSALLLARDALMPPKPRRPMMLMTIPMLLFAGALAGWFARTSSRDLQPLHLAVPVPADVERVMDFDVSPDGQTMALVENWQDDSQSTRGIYVRDLGAHEFHLVQGTKGATRVRFSPSSTYLFFTRPDEGHPASEVRYVPLSGGPASTVFRSEQSGLLSSSTYAALSDEELLVISADGRALYRISTSSHTPVLVTKFEGGELDLVSTVAVPRSGSSFAIVERLAFDSSSGRKSRSLHRLDLDSGEMSLLLENATDVAFAEPATVLFRRGSGLFSAPFDFDRCELTGDPIARLDGVGSFRIARQQGHLMFDPSLRGEGKESLVIIDRSGNQTPLLERKGDYYSPSVSPDGNRLAYVFMQSEDDVPRIWVLDMSSGLTRPVSPPRQAASSPVWTADGRLAYSRRFGPQYSNTVIMAPVAGSEPELLAPQDDDHGTQSPSSFARDGRYAMISLNPYDGREPGIYFMEIGEPESFEPFFASPVIEGHAQFSPDSKWVVYHTNGSGRFEVYLRPFMPDNPNSAPIYPVSTAGGQFGLWSWDGSKIYFLAGENWSELHEVTIETDPEVKISEPQVILKQTSGYGSIAALPDDRFVMIRDSDRPNRQRDIRIILNWNPQAQ